MIALLAALVQFVDPFIGTGGHGHTFPGAMVPFGMIQPSPDTRLTGWDGCSGYHHGDPILYGFSHTHLSGTGIADYADILFVPATGAVKLTTGYRGHEDDFTHDPSGYGSHYSNERAEPGYYAVDLTDVGVHAELTTGLRVARHRYRGVEHILIDLDHRDEVLEASLQVLDDHTLQGMRRSRSWAKNQVVYFVAQFDQPFRAEVSGHKALLRFSVKDVQAKVAISAVDADGARKNLASEPGWDFDKARTAARAAWERELGRIAIDGGTGTQKRIFYTALYHALLQPNVFQDVDGRYLGLDLKPHQAAKGHTQHTVFSLWDTFRAAHPLYALIERKRTVDFINTFLLQYQQGGKLPVWELAANETNTMIGYHSVSVIADAYAKGIRGFDTQLALKAMKDSAGPARDFLQATDASESVSKTLENAYDDWCIATFAKAIGKPDAEFEKRAQSWRHLLDPDGFMRPRANGRWQTPFDPREVTFQYTEANAWQYSFFVPQDIDGLDERLHGKLAEHLDQCFSAESKTTGREQADVTGLVGQYAHGNEPSHHMAWLWVHAGQPWKTQAMVRRLLGEMYRAEPDGLIGNEDCGQMSAWYVLSALGMYAVTPGTPDYVLASPLFRKATLRLESGKRFTIKTIGDGIYVQSARLNGKAHSRAYLSAQDILRGGELVFTLGAQPSQWGVKEPPHTRVAETIVPAPYAEGPEFFSGTTTLSLHSTEPVDAIVYSLGAEEREYKEPLQLDKSATVKFRARRGATWSPTVEAQVHWLDPRRHLTLHNDVHRQYKASGDQALIDGVRGGPDFRLGAWQGYYGVDLDADLDLGVEQPLHKATIGFLQDQNSWIFMPLEVRFSTSPDGQRWTEVGVAPNPVDPHADGTVLHDFTVTFPEQRARYVRVHAKSPVMCPAWHKGAGNRAFIFADELIVE